MLKILKIGSDYNIDPWPLNNVKHLKRTYKCTLLHVEKMKNMANAAYTIFQVEKVCTYVHAKHLTALLQDPNLLIREIFNDQSAHDKLMQSMFSHMASYGFPENFPADGSIFNASSHMVCNQVGSRFEACLHNPTDCVVRQKMGLILSAKIVSLDFERFSCGFQGFFHSKAGLPDGIF
jgi:hypothetical protein